MLVCGCHSSVGMVVSFPTVLVIAGTTAVGKTDLSLELTKMLNGEIVSADSVQVGPAVANSFSEQMLYLFLFICFGRCING